jgi:NADH-quinone oxidoreductase subunit D/NADH-quinone oxidoreductase subunit C/D
MNCGGVQWQWTLGAFTPFLHAFRERETINDIMEETCGARLHYELHGTGGE